MGGLSKATRCGPLFFFHEENAGLFLCVLIKTNLMINNYNNKQNSEDHGCHTSNRGDSAIAGGIASRNGGLEAIEKMMKGYREGGMKSVHADVPTVPVKTAPSGLTMLNPNEIIEMEFTPGDLYLDNGVFQKGQMLALLGPGGVGKSRLSLQLLICLILGKPFLGMQVNCSGLKCAVLQTENGNRRLKADLEKMKTALTEDEWTSVSSLLKIHALKGKDDGVLYLDVAANAARVAETLEKEKPDIVLCDPLNAFTTRSVNNDTIMTNTCRKILEVVRSINPDAGIIAVHHALTGMAGVKKATGAERASYGRGSKALNGIVRGQINVAPGDPHDSDKIVIACGKNSNGKEFATLGAKLNTSTMMYEVDPSFDYQTWLESFREAGVVVSKADPFMQVTALVDVKPLKRKKLVDALVNETECSESGAYALVKRAEVEGKIVRMKDGKYTAPQAKAA